MTTNQPTTGLAQWLCLDIETYHGNPEEAAKHVRQTWWPDEGWTRDTIGKRFMEKIEDTRQKMALIDAAEIATIQLRSPVETVLLHKFFAEERQIDQGAAGALPYRVYGFNTERELLLAFRTFAEQRTDDATLLVGWNIEGFDLRKLRHRMIKNRLNVARLLRTRQPVFDMMDHYVSDWSVDRRTFVKLLVALELFGIPTHKAEMDGSMVGQLIEAKRYGDVIAYGLNDLNDETELYLRMTGQSQIVEDLRSA